MKRPTYSFNYDEETQNYTLNIITGMGGQDLLEKHTVAVDQVNNIADVVGIVNESLNKLDTALRYYELTKDEKDQAANVPHEGGFLEIEEEKEDELDALFDTSASYVPKYGESVTQLAEHRAKEEKRTREEIKHGKGEATPESSPEAKRRKI